MCAANPAATILPPAPTRSMGVRAPMAKSTTANGTVRCVSLELRRGGGRNQKRQQPPSRMSCERAWEWLDAADLHTFLAKLK
mmetsp:Transcript_37715/g.63391  ORF Transcript_37715/g.63391 Transcript_37715/m.63391 type:complete len:82 (-) Transcript_37715:221-466(-)